MNNALRNFFNEAKNQIKLTGAILFGFAGSAWLFYVLPKMAAEYVFESHSSIVLRVIWFIVVVPLSVAAVWTITSERAIKTNWIKPTIPALIVVGFAVLEISGLLFSSLVYVMANNEMVVIVPKDSMHTISIASLMDLFMWHFLEAIPSLHINDLLKFKEPYEFDGRVGLLVLLFQLGVIFPIIGFHRKIVKMKKEAKEAPANAGV